MDKRESKIHWIGNGWSAVGLIALVGLGLAILIHPVFFSIFLVYPFTPFFFVFGRLPFVIFIIVVAVIFLAVGEGLRKQEVWSRFAGIGLALLTSCYFVAVLIGLWGQFVRTSDTRFLWLVPGAVLWIAMGVPAILFLLNQEVGKLFEKTGDFTLVSKPENAQELGTAGK